jgi:hypothetical protein
LVIVEGIARIIRHRDAMGAAARRRAVERFDLEPWFERHGAVFHACLREAA